MTPETAFTNASGADLPVIVLVVAGVITAVMLLWAGWALLSVWFGWARNRVDGDVAQRALLRIVLLTVVIFWIVL